MAGSSDYMRNYRTPTSNKRKRNRRSSTSSRFNGAVDTLAGMAADAGGFGSAYRGGKLAYSAAKKMFKGKRLFPKAAVKGYSGYTRNAGKIKKGKKYSKKISVKGQLTDYGITNKGIQTHFEFRKTATGVNTEGLFIGHTSLPGKQSGINFWRAILKYLMVKATVEVRDYGKRMFDFGFGNFDQIVVYWYEAVEQAQPFPIIATINTNTTFDQVAAQLANSFAATGDLSGNACRLDSIVYIPVNSPNPELTAKLSRTTVNLNCAKIAVSTVSKLKIQNVTVEVAADNEADDVTRVPLQGRMYNCKGNNVEFKSNRNCLPGFFDASDEVALCQTFTKGTSSIFGGNTQNFYGEGTQTPYYKTTEMPQPWEITNCSRTGMFTVQPGDIKTSTLNNKFTVSINYMFRLLYQLRVGRTGVLGYNPKLGKTAAMYLEKVVGKAPTASNSVTIWTELEFKQSMCVTGKMNTYTLPITYQVDFVT